MCRPRHKKPGSTSLGNTAPDTFDLDMLLNTSSGCSALEPAFQLQHVAVSNSSTTPMSPTVTPPLAVDSVYSSDGNDKLQPVDPLLDCEWDSEHLFVESSLFQDFQNNYHEAETKPSYSPASKQEYLEKLANRSSVLFKQLNHIDSSQTAGAAYIPSPLSSSMTSTLDDCSRDTMTSKGSRYPIGQILESSQKFLGILKYFLLSSSIKPPSSQQSHSEATNSDWEREDKTPNTKASSSSSNPHPRGSNSPNPSPGPDPTIPSQSAVPNFSSLLNPSTLANSPLLHLDLPTILSILTCYVSLIRVYRSILTGIYNVLQSSNPPSPLGLPPILPGLSLDGFHLEHHYSLQINILTQVSMDLLQRIERAVAALAGGEMVGDAAGAFGWKGGYTSLLEMVVREEAPGEQGGMESLRVLVRNIKRSLEENVCMQLEEAEAQS